MIMASKIKLKSQRTTLANNREFMKLQIDTRERSFGVSRSCAWYGGVERSGADEKRSHN